MKIQELRLNRKDVLEKEKSLSFNPAISIQLAKMSEDQERFERKKKRYKGYKKGFHRSRYAKKSQMAQK
jgi:hypothetical protein